MFARGIECVYLVFDGGAGVAPLQREDARLRQLVLIVHDADRRQNYRQIHFGRRFHRHVHAACWLYCFPDSCAVLSLALRHGG